MSKKSLLLLVTAFIMLTSAITSCSKQEPVYFETGNPLPGSWYAENVDYEGNPVTFTAEISDDFIEGSGIYCLEGSNAGTIVAKYGDVIVEQAELVSAIYNSKTYTGQFTLHYAEDPEDTMYEMMFYYEPKRDKFTTIQLNFNVTFTRK